MDFFKKYFPKTTNNIQYSPELISAINLLAPRFAFRKETLATNSSVYFSKYIIPSDTSPEILASQLYGSTNYAQLLLLLNQIYSIYDQWPKNNIEFRDYLKKKYAPRTIETLQRKNWTLEELSNTNPIPVHSFYLNNRKISFSEYKKRIIENPSYKTFYEYEFEENERKREIKIPKRAYLSLMESQLESLVKQTN